MPWNKSGRFTTTASQEAIDLAKERCNEWITSLGLDPQDPKYAWEWTAFLDEAMKSLQNQKRSRRAAPSEGIKS